VRPMGGYVKSVSLLLFMRCWRELRALRRILSGDVAFIDGLMG
jgi:hypothetical protein